MDARLDPGGNLEKGDVSGLLVIIMRLYSGLSFRDHMDAVTVKMEEDVLTWTALEQAEERQGLPVPNSAASFQDSLGKKRVRISVGAFCRPACGQSGPMSVRKPVKTVAGPILGSSIRLTISRLHY
jgi:hypothetical protein